MLQKYNKYLDYCYKKSNLCIYLYIINKVLFGLFV